MLDFNKFEFLTFDCYGTLVNWEDGILRCLHRLIAAHGKNLDDSSILRMYGDYEAAAESGEYRSYRDVLRSVVKRFGDALGFKPTDQEAYSLAESLKEWKAWPDTASSLSELHKRFRFAIISNTDDDLFADTQPQLGIKFDHVVTSQMLEPISRL